MASKRNVWIRVVVFGLATVLAALIWINREQFVPVQQGSSLPDYAVQTLAGEPFSMASLEGQPTILNVWATWCPPCVREMPALQRVHEQLGPQGLRIVAVSVDSRPGLINAWGRPGGDVQEFLDRLGLTFEILWDPSGELETAYSLPGLPTTFLIDRRGRIVQKVVGWREWDSPAQLAEIRRLLED
jgi:cytochrome c biogenesis protein CcmG, thiol:disulfide interchange protein DsbE